MKKIITSVVILTTIALQTTFAQSEQKNPLGNDSTISKDPLSMVLSCYLNLKNALIKDDGESASAAAQKLFKAIDKVQTTSFTKQQKSAWEKYSEKLSYDAEHIKGTTDIDHEREHFISLSKNMYEVVKAFNTNTVAIYYQYCPMANDGKGAYWVSAEQKINNPYFGKKMLTCGSTKETLNTNK
jgi:hypothetical protein